MARTRSIKPGFFMNEELADAGMAARLLFVGLWTLADRDGRLEDKPRRIRAQLFPFDDVDVDGELTVLERSGHIRRYRVGDRALLQVVNFSKHQRPHHTEKASELPDESEASSPEIEAECGPEPDSGASPVEHGGSPLEHGGNPPVVLVSGNRCTGGRCTVDGGAPARPSPRSCGNPVPGEIADEDWGRYTEFRASRGKPVDGITAGDVARAITGVAKANSITPTTVIATCIASGWVNVLPHYDWPKPPSRSSDPRSEAPPGESHAERARRLAERRAARLASEREPRIVNPDDAPALERAS